MKISDVLEGFWLEKKRQFSERTVGNYTRIFDQLIEHLGDREFESITTVDIRRHLDYLETQRGLAKRSVYDAWIGLSSLWTWASPELSTPHVIRGKIKAPKFPKTDVDPFTKDDLQRLLVECEYTGEWETRRGRMVRSRRETGLRDRALILVLVDSGIRVSELCALELRDYDQGRGRLHIRHGKGDKSRYVFLGDRARRALWKYLGERANHKPGQPLFATRNETHMTDYGAFAYALSIVPLFATRNETHMTRRNLGHLLERLGERAGIEHVHPHRFRHTFAITYLRNGGNLLELQKLLGHESLEMVKRYAKLAEVDLERARDKSVGDHWKL